MLKGDHNGESHWNLCFIYGLTESHEPAHYGYGAITVIADLADGEAAGLRGSGPSASHYTIVPKQKSNYVIKYIVERRSEFGILLS